MIDNYWLPVVVGMVYIAMGHVALWIYHTHKVQKDKQEFLLWLQRSGYCD